MQDNPKDLDTLQIHWKSTHIKMTQSDVHFYAKKLPSLAITMNSQNQKFVLTIARQFKQQKICFGSPRQRQRQRTFLSA